MRDVVVSSRSKDCHPHEQPVADAIFFIGCLSRPRDLVVDVCCGSASSGCAVVRLGERRYVGCDQDKRAVAVARRRIAAEIKERKPFRPFEPMSLGNLDGIV
jgi:predicted RNA methylase